MMDFLPIWVTLVVSILLVQLCIEIGYRFGRTTHRQAEIEQESSVTAMVGSVLGLTAFVLAFTFGIVYERYDDKKNLVREEANAIWTAYQRADFLAEPDRIEAKKQMRRYLNLHLSVPFAKEQNQQETMKMVKAVLRETKEIQATLWANGIQQVRNNPDLNSDIGALYLESLNHMTNIQELRVAAGIETRVHSSIWLTLYILTFGGMLALGFQTGITGSNRSKASPILACSFGILLTLIAALDRPGVILVTQQPLFDIQASMNSVSK